MPDLQLVPTLDDYLDNYITPCGLVQPDPDERNDHLRTCKVCTDAGISSLCGRVFLDEDVLIDHYASGCLECETIHKPNCQNPDAHRKD